jgi:hypothetical protein
VSILVRYVEVFQRTVKSRAIRQQLSAQLWARLLKLSQLVLGKANHFSGCIQSVSDVERLQIEAPGCNMSKKPHFPSGIRDLVAWGK